MTQKYDRPHGWRSNVLFAFVAVAGIPLFGALPANAQHNRQLECAEGWEAKKNIGREGYSCQLLVDRQCKQPAAPGLVFTKRGRSANQVLVVYDCKQK